jgi:hypothetical protein
MNCFRNALTSEGMLWVEGLTRSHLQVLSGHFIFEVVFQGLEISDAAVVCIDDGLEVSWRAGNRQMQSHMPVGATLRHKVLFVYRVRGNEEAKSNLKFINY